MKPIPLIIDTDMAMDDWMAIIYLMQSEDVDLRAVTIAATGEAHAQPGVRNALRLAALCGVRGVRVAAGRSLPLRGKNAFPWLVRFIMDRMLFLRLPAAIASPDPDPAVEVMAQEIRKSEDKLTIVALGPLTNLAELFECYPELIGRIAHVYSMGGALNVPGNLREMLPQSPNLHAEWNDYCDPYACSVVIRSGVPLTLVPLDATNQVPLTPDFIRRVQAAPGTPPVDFLNRLLSRISRLLGPSRTFYMWDPLTAVAAVHPEVLGTETIAVCVEEDGPQQGSVFADPAGSPIQVALRADPQAFEDHYLRVLQK